MIIEITGHKDGRQPETFSINLTFIKPGPEIPIKIDLDYYEAIKDSDDYPTRVEITRVYFQYNNILLNYEEEVFNHANAKGWKRIVHMFKRTGYTRDVSFNSKVDWAPEDGVSTVVNTMPGIVAVHGLRDGTYDYDIHGVDIASGSESSRYLFESRGAKPPKSPGSDSMSLVLSDLESPKSSNTEKTDKDKDEGDSRKTEQNDESDGEINDTSPKRKKLNESEMVNVKRVDPDGVKYVLNGFEWEKPSITDLTVDSDDIKGLDLDNHGECQKYIIGNKVVGEEIFIHLHVPKSANNKALGSKQSPLIVYFTDAENSFFHFESKNATDRERYFITDGRKFVRDYCYVLSIGEPTKTEFMKQMNSVWLERIAEELKYWFTKDLITVVGNGKGAFNAMMFLIQNPSFTDNIVLYNPYLNTVKNTEIDDLLKQKWENFLKKQRNIIIGCTHKRKRFEKVVELITGVLCTEQCRTRKDLMYELAGKIELLPDLHRFSLMGLVFHNFKRYIKKSTKESVSGQPLDWYNDNIAENVNLV